MTKTKYTFLLLILCFSCTTKDTIQGKWILHSGNSTDCNPPQQLLLEKDSIWINSIGFNSNSKYRFEHLNDDLFLLDKKIKTTIHQDTLSLNNLVYIREDKATPIAAPVTLDLPKIASLGLDNIKTDRYSEGITFAKKPDHTFALQLRDKYADFNDLTEHFLQNKHPHNLFRKILFFCNKDAKMGDVEKILFYSHHANQLRIELINDYVFHIDNQCLYDDYFGVSLKIPLEFNYEYGKEILQKTSLRSPYANLPPLQLDTEHNTHFFFLVENQIYYQNKINKDRELITLFNGFIAKGEPVVLLYDKKSEYTNFLKFVIFYQDEMKRQRTYASIKSFKKTFDHLAIKQKRIIAEKIPYKALLGYSIDHFLSFQNQEEALVQFDFENFKAKIPVTFKK